MSSQADSQVRAVPFLKGTLVHQLKRFVSNILPFCTGQDLAQEFPGRLEWLWSSSTRLRRDILRCITNYLCPLSHREHDSYPLLVYFVMAFKCSLRDKKILFTLKNENLPLSCSLNYNIQADERINSSNTFVLQLLSLLGVKQWNDFVKGPIIWPHGCEKRHLPWTRCKVTLPLRCVDSLAPLDTLP